MPRQTQPNLRWGNHFLVYPLIIVPRQPLVPEYSLLLWPLLTGSFFFLLFFARCSSISLFARFQHVVYALSLLFFSGKHVVYGYGHVRFHQGWIQNKIIVGLNKLGESSAPISYESIQIIFSGGLGGSPWSQWQ